MCLLVCLLVSKNFYNRARLGTSVLDIHNPRRFISILTVSTFNLRIFKKQYLSLSLYPYWSNPLAWYDYHISNKEKLTCRLQINKRSRSSNDLNLHNTRVSSSDQSRLWPSFNYKKGLWLSNFLKISLKSISINTEGGVAAHKVFGVLPEFWSCFWSKTWKFIRPFMKSS